MGRGQNLIYGEVDLHSREGEIEKLLNKHSLKEIFLEPNNDPELLHLLKTRRVPIFTGGLLRKTYDLVEYYSSEKCQHLHAGNLFHSKYNDQQEFRDQLLFSINDLIGKQDLDQRFFKETEVYLDGIFNKAQKLLNYILENNKDQVIGTNLSSIPIQSEAGGIYPYMDQLNKDVNNQLNRDLDLDAFRFQELELLEESSFYGLGLNSIRDAMILAVDDNKEEYCLPDFEEVRSKRLVVEDIVSLYHYIELIHDLNGEPFRSQNESYLVFTNSHQDKLKQLLKSFK